MTTDIAHRIAAAKSTDLQLTIAEEMSLTEVAQAFVWAGLFTDLANINEAEGKKATRQAMTKILAGREMGMEPVQAMMGLQIVEGRIGLTSDAMAARVLDHPDFRYRHEEFTHQTCRLRFEERDTDGKWEPIGTSEFTIWDAQAAGLCKVSGEGAEARAGATSRNGNALPWQAYTRNMLFNRAISNGFRWFVPHLKLPRLYTPEEIAETTGGGLHTPTDPDGNPAGPSGGGQDAPATAQGLDDLLAGHTAVDGEIVDTQTGEILDGNSSSPSEEQAVRSESQLPVANSDVSEDEAVAETDSGESAAEVPDEPLEASPGPAPADPVELPTNEPAPHQPDPNQSRNDYQQWLADAAQYKKMLSADNDDSAYRDTLAPFCPFGQEAKANTVPPDRIDDARRAFHAAVEKKGRQAAAPAPSPTALSEAGKLKKAELIEGVPELERLLRAVGGEPPRAAYGVPQDNMAGREPGVAGLRVYYARLQDLVAEGQKTADQQQGSML